MKTSTTLNSKIGIEIELIAPVGKSRLDLATAIAMGLIAYLANRCIKPLISGCSGQADPLDTKLFWRRRHPHRTKWAGGTQSHNKPFWATNAWEPRMQK